MPLTLHGGWRRVMVVGLLCLAGVARGEEGKAAGETGAAASAPADSEAIVEGEFRPSDSEVLSAINRGVDFLLADMAKRLEPLKKASESDLSKPNLLGDPGRFTLEAYALLHVGRDLKDPRLYFRDPHMAGAVNVLTHEQIDYTYTTSLQALALAELPPTPEIKKALATACKRLINGTAAAGGYDYNIDKAGSGRFDDSNSQYGLLGTWAAADFGIEVPVKYWKDSSDFWRSHQNPDGGWPYQPGPTKPSMTAAGMASLLVCQEFLDRTPTLVQRDDPAMESGMENLTKGFDPTSSDLYYLYGVERTGLASGQKFLGHTDWYRAAAVNVLKMQQQDGSFNASFTGSDQTVSTSYALLFLARGRAPVVMNKLQYNGPWNVRLRDSANMHAYLSKVLEKHLNWQVVPVDVPYEEWLDAPLLLITGQKDPGFTEEEVGKLRSFVNAGGIIVSTADGASAEFTEAMKHYAMEVGPAGSQWRQLPADHPLFTVYTHPKQTPVLYGLSNGVRELWIHCPEDYGAIWQSYKIDKRNREAWEFPAQALFYAAGKSGLRSKLQTLLVPAPKKPPAHHVSVAQVQYGGNWDPEPGAWPRLGRILALRANTQMDLSTIKAQDLGTMEQKPALVHLCGTGKLVLSDEEQAALKVYVLSGGTLFVEALGGDPVFRDSAKALLEKLFPEGKLKTVPEKYLLYSGDFSPDALQVPQVEYRKYWILKNGPSTKPRLEYMTLDKRIGVFFSGEDITSGLLGTNTWGISGYMPESSVALARNLVLFSEINQVRHGEGK